MDSICAKLTIKNVRDSLQIDGDVVDGGEVPDEFPGRGRAEPGYSVPSREWYAGYFYYLT